MWLSIDSEDEISANASFPRRSTRDSDIGGRKYSRNYFFIVVNTHVMHVNSMLQFSSNAIKI